MWSIIHKTSKKGRKSSVIMTTHSMDETENLCKRMGIMVNGEFVCLGKANQIKDKYGYGYEIDIRIKPMNGNQVNELLKKLNEKESTFPYLCTHRCFAYNSILRSSFIFSDAQASIARTIFIYECKVTTFSLFYNRLMR